MSFIICKPLLSYDPLWTRVLMTSRGQTSRTDATPPAVEETKVWKNVGFLSPMSNTLSFTKPLTPKSANDPGAFRAIVHCQPRYKAQPSCLIT